MYAPDEGYSKDVCAKLDSYVFFDFPDEGYLGM